MSVYENGITYRKFVATWSDLKSVTSSAESGITLTKSNGESVTIGKTVADVDKIAVEIRRHLA